MILEGTYIGNEIATATSQTSTLEDIDDIVPGLRLLIES